MSNTALSMDNWASRENLSYNKLHVPRDACRVRDLNEGYVDELVARLLKAFAKFIFIIDGYEWTWW